jgi:isoquinoline 1-oxidoreductase subunit beta
MAGGSFGRRANMASDYIVEAVSIAKVLGATGVPFKLQWSREDDIQGGRYRPIYVHRLKAALDNDGRLFGWRHRIVGQPIMTGTAFAATGIKNGIDRTSVESAANLPYAVPNMAVELNTTETGVPDLWWRAVGSSHTAYANEAFTDEIAHAASKDPFAFRQAMLEHHPRHKALLQLVAKAAGWGDPLPKGRSIAIAEAFGTYVAQVCRSNGCAERRH